VRWGPFCYTGHIPVFVKHLCVLAFKRRYVRSTIDNRLAKWKAGGTAMGDTCLLNLRLLFLAERDRRHERIQRDRRHDEGPAQPLQRSPLWHRFMIRSRGWLAPRSANGIRPRYHKLAANFVADVCLSTAVNCWLQAAPFKRQVHRPLFRGPKDDRFYLPLSGWHGR
jgi:hypothetical protein